MAKRRNVGMIGPIGGVYDTDEIAAMLGVHRRTVQRLIIAGELGAIKGLQA
jgi:transposase